jgi:hypothetical protein
VQIPGRLSETTLGDVLGALLRARVTGLVRLRETPALGTPREHRVFLSRGEVVAVETDSRVPVLGEILMQHGLLDARGQRRIRQRLTAGASRPIGELLVEEGYVSRDVIGAALRKQLRSKLDALFQIREATLSFHVACLAPACPVAPLQPREFLRGRPRARDRMGRAGTSSRSHARSEPRRETSSPGRNEGSTPGPARYYDASTRRRIESLALLGLADGVTTAEVTKAFRQLAVRLHPDRHVSASDAERREMAARFAAVSAAYHAVIG